VEYGVIQSVRKNKDRKCGYGGFFTARNYLLKKVFKKKFLLKDTFLKDIVPLFKRYFFLKDTFF